MIGNIEIENFNSSFLILVSKVKPLQIRQEATF